MTKSAVSLTQPADMAEATIAAGRRVLEMEGAGLAAMAAALDFSFAHAVDILLGIKGRVIVSGMGKSGHIGRKIAATLASTGTPAFFVHPAEASHGDLGMITREDAVICISYSGNTNELADIVGYTRRFSIPLIGMVGGLDSTLGRAADVVLPLAEAAEACPMGLAPTTSTTMALALGDALAVALLERQGFSPDQFKIFHPSGSLGKRLLKVSDIMHKGDALPLIDANAQMSEALLIMTNKSFGCVAATDSAGKLIGIVTDGDLRRHMGDGLLQSSVRVVMTSHPKTIGPDALVQEALARMNDQSITSLFVCDQDNHPIGIIRMHDVLRVGVA